MSVKKNIIALFSGLAFLTGLAQPANACYTGTCSISDVQGALACVGPASARNYGNAYDDAVSGFFGQDDWTIIERAESNGWQGFTNENYEFNNDIGLDITALSWFGREVRNSNVGSYTFTLGENSMYQNIMVTLKAGREFYAYLLSDEDNPIQSRDGLWMMRNGSELSHFAVWGAGSLMPVAAVPIPAAALLFGTGLAGLGLVGRRKKQKSAQ